MLRQNLPNALTCGNLLCGMAGIYTALVYGDLYGAVGWMWLAGLLDVLDGALARALRVASPIGQDLDSLADGVTFGVLPAMLSCQAIAGLQGPAWMQFACFVLGVAAVVRLAIFNNDPGQAKYFKGIPTPAGALGLSGMIIQMSNDDPLGRHPWLTPGAVLGFTLGVAALEVSGLPLISFKLGMRRTWPYWLAVLVVAAATLPWAQGFVSLVALGLYVLVSQVYFRTGPGRGVTDQLPTLT